MGLFKRAEEKRQRFIRELEELIAAYDNEKAPKWQYCLAEAADHLRKMILQECERRKKYGFII